MALVRKSKNEDGTYNFDGTTWGREIVDGRFDLDGTLPIQNPQFNSDSLAFETNLGTLAFSQGEGAAAMVADSAVRYLEARASDQDSLGNAARDMDDLLELCGTEKKNYAGAVGTEPTDVRAALESGNTRERLTAVGQFVEHVLVSDVLKKGHGKAKLMEIMQEAGFHMERLRELKATSNSKWDSPFHKPQEQEGNLAGNVDTSRANRSDVGQENPDTTTDLTTATVSTEISDAERAHMELEAAATEQALTWTEGAKKILMNENDDWVQSNRQFSIPLKGGPSGHTYKFMQANQIMQGGASPDEMRLACLGYLLPINAHSCVEVMEAAKTFGCSPFPINEKIYRYIAPLTDAQLRQCGINGRYPDEPTDAAVTDTLVLMAETNYDSVPEDLRPAPVEEQAQAATDTAP